MIVNTTDNAIAFGENIVDLRNGIIILLDEGVCSAMGENNAVVEGFDEAAATVVVS